MNVHKTRPMNDDAMRAPVKRPWCRDHEPMTPERIMRIARVKGGFTVHRYLYRASALRRTCGRMVDNGLLRRAGHEGDFLVFRVARVKA